MARVLHRILSIPRRKWTSALLALVWCGGLACGITLFFLAGDSAVSLMRQAAHGRVSIVNLLMANLLPFLFSAFSVYIRKPGLLYGCAFCKALLFAFVSAGTLLAFGSAGWLIRLLLMFSDLVSTVLLYVYWLRHISGLRRFSPLPWGASAAAVLLVGSVDHCFVAPLLARLLEL